MSTDYELLRLVAMIELRYHLRWPARIMWIVRVVWRIQRGGWFVFRDAPEWFVADVASIHVLDGNSEFISELSQQAVDEMVCRERKNVRFRENK